MATAAEKFEAALQNNKASAPQSKAVSNLENIKNESNKVTAAAEKKFEATAMQSKAVPDRKDVKTEDDKTAAFAEKKETAATEKTETVKDAPIIAPFDEKILNTPEQISDPQIIASAEIISKIGNEIIERLMIAQSVNAAKQEVVIVFKENVLPGTQVSLFRDGSELSLTFKTVNTQSLELLTAGQDNLQNFLVDQLKDIKAVHIKLEGRESDDLNEKNQQRRQQNQQSQEENDENTPQK
jgi:hypothetical protein